MASEINHKSRIPVTLVTGFLGSGKTTLINRALRAAELAGTVVVVNEFGEVGLDHHLFTNSDDAVVVLENGCLCCTVKSDLVSTLNNLFHDRQAGRISAFNNVVIETSGLAEPGPVLQAFLSEPTLDGLYRVGRVLTLVDAINWESTASAHDEAVRQVALADTILVSKLDLIGTERQRKRQALFDGLRAINLSADIGAVPEAIKDLAAHLSSPGFDPADPTGNPLPWLSLANHEAHHHRKHEQSGVRYLAVDPHFATKGIESFILTRLEPVARGELQFLLDGISQNLGPSLLRVKGLVNVREEPGKPAVIHGAQHLLHTMTWLERWPDADERSRIVFITQGIASDKLKEIVELLDRMSERTFKARERGRQLRLAEEKKQLGTAVSP
jgi:G3E family GTPase